MRAEVLEAEAESRSARLGLTSRVEWSRVTGVLGSPHIDTLEWGGWGLSVGIVGSGGGQGHGHRYANTTIIGGTWSSANITILGGTWSSANITIIGGTWSSANITIIGGT